MLWGAKTKLCNLVLHLSFVIISQARTFCALFRHLELTFVVVPSTLFLSFRAFPFVSCRASARNPAHGCFTALRFVQHDRVMSCRTLLVMACTLFPCHSEHPFPCHSEHSPLCHAERQRGIQRMDASLRCASFSMIGHRQDAIS